MYEESSRLEDGPLRFSSSTYSADSCLYWTLHCSNLKPNPCFRKIIIIKINFGAPTPLTAKEKKVNASNVINKEME